MFSFCPECRDGEKPKHSTLGGRGARREEEEEEVDGEMTTSRAEGKSDKKTVCFDQTVLYDTSDDDEDESTQPYVPEGTTAKGPTESGVEQTPSDDRGKEGTEEEEGATMEVEPTVVYHLEEDTPERTMAGDGADPTVPYVLEESKEDMETESLPRAHSSRTPGTSGMVAEELGEEDGVVSDVPSGGTKPATKVEQILPYSLGEESEDVKKGKEEEEEKEKEEGEEALGEKRTTSSVSGGTSKGHPEEQPERRSKSKEDEALSLEEAERMDSPDQSNIRSGGGELPVGGGDHLLEEQEKKKEEEEKEEGDSIGSDLDATIPALLDASKQKTLFARQRGRGRRGRGSGGRGRGASARRTDTRPAVEEQRGKGRRGKEMKPKAMATTMEVESTSSVAAVSEGGEGGEGGDETRGRRGKQRAGRRQRTRTLSKVAADSGAVEGEMETIDVVEPSTSEPNPSVNTSIGGSLSEESPDITLHPPGPAEVPKHEDQSSRSPVDGDQSGHSSITSSASTPTRTDPPVASGSSSGSRRGRGRGRGRGRRPSTPRKGIAAKPALKSEGTLYSTK